jgi:hypothetical protein
MGLAQLQNNGGGNTSSQNIHNHALSFLHTHTHTLMPTTYTIEYILIKISFQNRTVQYVAETLSHSSNHCANSDDAIKKLHTMLKRHANESNHYLDGTMRMHAEYPEWINNAIHDWTRCYYTEAVVELLDRSSFTFVC